MDSRVELVSMIQKVVDQWRSANIPLRRGTSGEDVRQWEERFKLRLPEDLRAYFSVVDGMPDRYSDDQGIYFWPLADVVPLMTGQSVPDPADGAAYFGFADYSIRAHDYAVRISGDQPTDVVIVGASPTRVASPFTQFLWKYLDRPESVFQAEPAADPR